MLQNKRNAITLYEGQGSACMNIDKFFRLIRELFCLSFLFLASASYSAVSNMSPAQKEVSSPYYMHSVMKRFGHHLSTEQSVHLAGQMAGSLQSAPQGSCCSSLPRVLTVNSVQTIAYFNQRDTALRSPVNDW